MESRDRASDGNASLASERLWDIERRLQNSGFHALHSEKPGAELVLGWHNLLPGLPEMASMQ